MLNQEIKRVRKLLTKVLNTAKLDSGQEKRLRTVQRELDKIVASGRVEKARVIRVIDILATLLLEIQHAEDSVD